jgi:molybdate/tungstate transport system substrate-binding protein
MRESDPGRLPGGRPERSRKDAMRIRLTGLFAVAACTALIAGCSSSSSPTASTSTSASATASRGSGKVEILYAGSLVNVMEKTIGPAFSSATGYTYEGEGAGASELASEIKAKTVRGDVFISASPKVDATLEGAANGDWVSWYATFGSSDLVLAYNPKSKFASALQTEPWYKVLTEPGIKIGRTDPTEDPKGELTVAALKQAQTTFDDPTLEAKVEANSQVFPEEDLVGRLESGQLDAGFFYTVEATAADLHTVSLNLPTEKATFTVTVLKGGANEAGGIAFVNYLLGSAGRSELTAAGMALTPTATLTGAGADVPSQLQPLFNG